MKRNKLIFNSTIAFILLITVILCEEWSKKKSEMIDQTSFSLIMELRRQRLRRSSQAPLLESMNK